MLGLCKSILTWKLSGKKNIAKIKKIKKQKYKYVRAYTNWQFAEKQFTEGRFHRVCMGSFLATKFWFLT